MKKVIFSTRGNNSTPSRIEIGDVLGSLEELVAGRRVVVITDENLLGAYAGFFERYDHIVIPTTERYKTLATVEFIHRELLARGADRGSYLVGFGGGIVTDITGFAASTYMRGIGFGFVATSLLAQVDASVGGKNGVNLDGYKNIIGTFNQPDFVLCDLSVLSTLPERELRAGMVEALKCGILSDVELFGIFERYDFEQIVSSKELLFEIVSRSVEFKASIVARDERESGVRKLLNLGHTFAHGIEKLTSRYIHGEAVAIGLVLIAGISCRRGLLSAESHERILRTIRQLDLPQVCAEIDFADIARAAKSDKKKHGSTIELILIRDIGDCVIESLELSELDML